MGSTSLVQLDETLAHQRIRDTFGRLSGAVSDHQGLPHEIRGDALVAEFSRASDAVSAALAFQKQNATYNDQLCDDVRPVVRIGIAIGEVVIGDGTLTGEGVVMAQRLEQLAQPGGVCIQGAAYETVPRRFSFPAHNLGLQNLKGFDHPVLTYALGETAGRSNAEPEQQKSVEVTEAPSVAVLPFTNMSGDPEQEYFADGITEDIITELSKLAGILVISRNSTFTYKGQAVKVQDVCQDLGVRHVLEGSVRKAGNRVRITAQLIDGKSGGHEWAERYDRSLDDIFEVQDDVTLNIVQALEGSLLGTALKPEQRIESHKPEAYDCVLRGREQYRLFTREGNLNARRLFEQAIALDPGYAEAYAGLAGTSLHDWFGGQDDALDRTFDLAVKANAIDPYQPAVYEALGNAHLFKRQHDEAVAVARRWVDIEPSNADAYANLAGALIFAGEPETVESLIDEAISMNPFFPFYYPLYKGAGQFLMRHYDVALQNIVQAVKRNPSALHAQIQLAACCGLMDRPEQAHEALAQVRKINPEFSIAYIHKYYPYKRAADSDLLIDGLKRAGITG